MTGVRVPWGPVTGVRVPWGPATGVRVPWGPVTGVRAPWGPVTGVRGAAALGALRLTVRGGLAGVWVRGKIPMGPVVLAANHHSWWDPFIAMELVAHARRRGALVVDPASLRRYRFARHLGAIGADEPRAGLAALRDGAVLVIYPETRLLPAGPPGPLAEGAAWLARRGRARLCSAAVRVVLRGGQFGEAYVSLGEVEASGSREAVTGRLHERLRQDLAELDRLNAVADPREPLPGLRCTVRARRGWDERVDAVRSWAGR